MSRTLNWFATTAGTPAATSAGATPRARSPRLPRALRQALRTTSERPAPREERPQDGGLDRRDGARGRLEEERPRSGARRPRSRARRSGGRRTARRRRGGGAPRPSRPSRRGPARAPCRRGARGPRGPPRPPPPTRASASPAGCAAATRIASGRFRGGRASHGIAVTTFRVKFASAVASHVRRCGSYASSHGLSATQSRSDVKTTSVADPPGGAARGVPEASRLSREERLEEERAPALERGRRRKRPAVSVEAGAKPLVPPDDLPPRRPLSRHLRHDARRPVAREEERRRPAPVAREERQLQRLPPRLAELPGLRPARPGHGRSPPRPLGACRRGRRPSSPRNAGRSRPARANVSPASVATRKATASSRAKRSRWWTGRRGNAAEAAARRRKDRPAHRESARLPARSRTKHPSGRDDEIVRLSEEPVEARLEETERERTRSPGGSPPGPSTPRGPRSARTRRSPLPGRPSPRGPGGSSGPCRANQRRASTTNSPRSGGRHGRDEVEEVEPRREREVPARRRGERRPEVRDRGEDGTAAGETARAPARPPPGCSSSVRRTRPPREWATTSKRNGSSPGRAGASIRAFSAGVRLTVRWSKPTTRPAYSGASASKKPPCARSAKAAAVCEKVPWRRRRFRSGGGARSEGDARREAAPPRAPRG